MTPYIPPYGDLVALNTRRDLLDTVGHDLLAGVVQGYLALLDTSAAIHEVNGDYATALFTSVYCRLLDLASRRLCDTDDNRAALDSGRWHCHESCWSEASRIAVETGQPFDLRPCRGGINVYAVPIVADGQTIGALNFGYGAPPADEPTLAEIAARYGVDVAELRRAAEAYQPRPEAVIEAAKRNLHTTANLVAETYLRRKASQSSQRRAAEAELMQRVHEALGQGAALDEVLRLVAEGARALFAGHAATVYFLSDDRRHLSLQNWALPDKLIRSIEKLIGLDVRHFPLPLVEGGHYWRAIEERRALLLDRPEQIEALVAGLTAEHPALTKVVPAIVRLLGHRAVLIAPLVAGGEVVGVMDLGSRQRLDKEDRRRFQLLATRMGLIIERARLFEQVTALEEFNERVLSSIYQGVIVLDTEGRIRYLNDFVKTRYGWSGELVGQDVFEYRPVYRQVGLYDAFRQVVDTGEPGERLGVAHPDHTGRQLVRDFYGYPLREEGRLTGVVVVVNDVTAEHRLEEKLAAVHELGQELVLTLDVEHVAQVVVNAAERMLDFRVCSLWLVDEERNVLVRWASAPGEPAVGISRLPLDGERGITVAVARSGEAIYLPDVTADARYVKGSIESRSELCVPLKVEEQVIGVLNAESEELDAFDQADMRLLSTLAGQAALAIENARLYDETRRRLTREERLNELAHTLGGELELASLIPRLLPPVAELTAADAATVAILDPDRQAITYPYNFNLPGILAGEEAPAGSALAGHTMEVRQPVLLDDYREHPAAVPAWVEAGVRSMLSVPLLADDEAVGALGLFSLDEVRPFGPEAVAAAEAAGRLAAVAIQRARLFQAEQRRRQEAETLREAALALSTTLDRQKVFELILSQLQQVVPYDSTSVQLLRDDRLEIIGGRGFPNLPELLGLSFPVDSDNPNREVVRRRRPFIVDDAPTVYEEFKREPHAQAGIRSWLGVPMLVGERLMGMIALDKREPGFYTEEHAQLAQAFAAQAAAAIENARLFEAAQHEIAERKRAEESLRESERSYRTLSENLPGTVYRVFLRQNNRVQFFNNMLRPMTGFTVEELVAGEVCSIAPLILPEDRAGVVTTVERAIVDDQPFQVEYRLKHKEGGIHYFLERGRPVRGADGNPLYIDGVIFDVTEQKQMQARLMQSQKLAAVGELVAGVAHELNNPLTSVVGYAQLLQRQPVEEGVRRKLDMICHEAQRSARIVNNLLAFARQHKPERRPVGVNDVVEKALELLAYQLRTDNVEVVRRLAPDLPSTMADPNQLEQVFVNLITNARQAMAEARGRGALTVTTELAGEDRIRMVFADDGPGIASQIMGRLFDPFFTTKEVGQGTGLGLSICYGLVAEHGGRIWAESEEGAGATFIVELPVEWEDVSRAEETLAQVKARPTHGRRILVVDDEELIIGLLTDVLQGAGHRVVGVTDGGAALRALERGEYDLIISDLKMPGLSGRELYAHLKAERPEMVERLVFTTGDVANPATKEFLARSGRRYLAKPFDIEVVEAVVDDALITVSQRERKSP